jgi:hypothetical protein
MEELIELYKAAENSRPNDKFWMALIMLIGGDYINELDFCMLVNDGT